MSQTIDLMPAASRLRIRGRSAARHWVYAYAAVAGAGAIAIAGLRVAVAARSAELSRLLKEVSLDAEYVRQATRLDAETARLAALIDRHARLAWPLELSDLLGALGDALPAPVALTSITVTPRFDAPKANKPEELPSPLSLVIEIAGVAPTDLDVASVIASLEGRGLFSRVTMDHARSGAFAGKATREFGLTCEIDLTSRRRGLLPAAAAGANEARP